MNNLSHRFRKPVDNTLNTTTVEQSFYRVNSEVFLSPVFIRDDSTVQNGLPFQGNWTRFESYVSQYTASATFESQMTLFVTGTDFEYSNHHTEVGIRIPDVDTTTEIHGTIQWQADGTFTVTSTDPSTVYYGCWLGNGPQDTELIVFNESTEPEDCSSYKYTRQTDSAVIN